MAGTRTTKTASAGGGVASKGKKPASTVPKTGITNKKERAPPKSTPVLVDSVPEPAPESDTCGTVVSNTSSGKRSSQDSYSGNKPIEKSQKKKYRVTAFGSPVKAKKPVANDYHIVFLRFADDKLVGCHLQRKVMKTSQTWASYLLFQRCSKKDKWCTELGLSPLQYYYHEDGKPVKSSPGQNYHERFYFFEHVFEFGSDEEFIEFCRETGRTIADHINPLVKFKIDQKITVPTLDSELVHYRPDDVLSDVVGVDAACQTLVAALGADYSGTAAEFAENQAFIYSIFHPGKIPREMATFLGCSASDIAPES